MYNGTKYAYILNLQGDVLGLVDSNGDEVVRYTYDAWGKVLSTTGSLASSLGALNPFRYRGYIYDTETGLYYLRARYYNPVWGKFVNADNSPNALLSTKFLSLYLYASNNPINRCDEDGKKDYIYTNPNQYYIENDWGFLEFLHVDRYFLEIDGKRYILNSSETCSLYSWNSIDFNFKSGAMQKIIRKANSIPFSIKRVWDESVNGNLDFKNQLSNNTLFMIDGILYNSNEAGNYMWAYYLCLHGINGNMSGYLAQGGTIVASRCFDEWWDRKARWAGVREAYKELGIEWAYIVTYGIFCYPQP